MIVAPAGGRLLVVTQNDHAHLAGELLALWRADGLPSHPRRRELLFAAREHDNGWAEADSAPICDRASGRPRDFMTVSRETRQAIWRRGTRRYTEREPYASLLIVRHAVRLHRALRADPAWADLLADWQQLEAELMASSGASAAEVESDDRWIELADLLSLAACNRWSREVAAHGFRAQLRRAAEVGGSEEADTLFIDPFPLAGATTFRAACRWIPDRRYSSDVDLGTELAVARWRHHLVRVSPYGGPPPAGAC